MSWQLQTLAISNTIILTGWWGLSLISFADEYEKNKKSGWFQEVDAAIKREAELRGPSVSHLKIYTKYIMLFKYKWLFLCCSPNNSIWSICYLVSRTWIVYPQIDVLSRDYWNCSSLKIHFGVHPSMGASGQGRWTSVVQPLPLLPLYLAFGSFNQ